MEFLCYALNEDLGEIKDWLDSSGTYTLFAPTDNAFNRLGADNIKELFNDDAKKLEDVVRYHISNRIYFEDDLTCDKKIDTELGDSSNDFTTTKCKDDEKFQVGNGNDENDRDKLPLIIETNIVTCNGVVHLVDNVILPQKE
ncbi:MAG: putative surface protein with fasciclin (FAS1) repeats [Bacillariaceae sp.]